MPATSAPVVPAMAPKAVVPVIRVVPFGDWKAAGLVVNPAVEKLSPPVASLVKLTVPALPPVVMMSALAVAAQRSGAVISAAAVRKFRFISSPSSINATLCATKHIPYQHRISLFNQEIRGRTGNHWARFVKTTDMPVENSSLAADQKLRLHCIIEHTQGSSDEHCEGA